MVKSDVANNQAQLLIIGRILMQDTISIMVETIIWGFYFLLFLYAMKIQLSKGVRSRTSIMMLCVTLVLFAISTGLWSLDVVQLIQGYKVMLYQNNANDLSQGVDKRYELLAEKSAFMEGFFLLTVSFMTMIIPIALISR
jgi:hypothetical protein